MGLIYNSFYIRWLRVFPWERMASTQCSGVLLEKRQIHVNILNKIFSPTCFPVLEWITFNIPFLFRNKTNNICFCLRNDGKPLGSLLTSLGELLTYHGMVLESKINDEFKVMDEESGKLVTDFSDLGGSAPKCGQQYEHNQWKHWKL